MKTQVTVQKIYNDNFKVCQQCMEHSVMKNEDLEIVQYSTSSYEFWNLTLNYTVFL